MSSNDANDYSTQDERSDTETPSKSGAEQPVKRTKRKKASRACFHCQKAHLTCDDSRPCQRCVKRGLDGTCQDGIRKKAKYLQDVDNDKFTNLHKSDAIDPNRSSSQPAPAHNAGVVTGMPQITEIGPPEGIGNLAAMARTTARSKVISDNGFGVFGDNLLFDYPALSTYDFDSKAANMEYSMLSNMLGSATTPAADYGQSPDTYGLVTSGLNGVKKNLPTRQHTITPDLANINSEPSWSHSALEQASGGHLGNGHNNSIGNGIRSTLPQIMQTSPRLPSSQIPSPSVSASQVPGPQVVVQTSGATPGSSTSSAITSPRVATIQATTGRALANPAYLDPHGQRPTPVARRPHSTARSDPSSIYKAITKPFSYTNGYHLLNTYLRSRFEKEDLLRIARAIVGYRPSFIALTKTLREEDLTFMEICFQRTLLEYEKFVGYSGTPTIIWRRTGQIELVGKEFCLLTQWSREQLLSKQTFIVELMDDSSVVEYFEKFSAHAFGDTSSVQTTCVLMTPQKRAVPCAFCFTIKRDVFDIPMMIVGNFLPVL